MAEITPDERFELNTTRLDVRGMDAYLDARNGGETHRLALVLALNDQREREKGLSWSAYKRVKGMV